MSFRRPFSQSENAAAGQAAMGPPGWSQWGWEEPVAPWSRCLLLPSGSKVDPVIIRGVRAGVFIEFHKVVYCPEIFSCS